MDFTLGLKGNLEKVEIGCMLSAFKALVNKWNQIIMLDKDTLSVVYAFVEQLYRAELHKELT